MYRFAICKKYKDQRSFFATFPGYSRLTETSFLILEIHLEVQLLRFRPPASFIVLRHDQQVEPAIVVEISWDDVADFAREGEVDERVSIRV